MLQKLRMRRCLAAFRYVVSALLHPREDRTFGDAGILGRHAE